jgi:transcriptional regulator with XRE-family HTH domain
MLNKEKNKTVQDDFSKRFRELRRKKNLSQAELGKIVGLHYTHIGRYERGLSKPSAEAARRLADALGVTTDYLIEGDSDDIAKSKLDNKELLGLFREIEKFNNEDKIVIKKLINAFIANKQIQEIAHR